MRKLIFVFLLAVTSSGCTLRSIHRGFVFPSDLDMQVARIKTTDELEKALGSPQVKTVLGETVWVYYGADENYHGPFPVTYDDKTALLAWSNGGKITKTKILKDNDFKDIQIDPDETPIPAAIELNAIDEMINNIGRFTPAGLGQ